MIKYSLLLASAAALATARGVLRATTNNYPGSNMCEFLPAPVVPGAEVVSVVGAEFRNYSATPQDDGSGVAHNVSGLNFCGVNVTLTHPGLDDAVIVEVWLPLEGWTGRFEGMGGGGYVAGALGSRTLPSAVARGNVGAITNGGGLGIDSGTVVPSTVQANGQVNLGLFTDFSSRGLHEVTVVGKAITTSFYGKSPHHSYWTGCSTGGRQGHMIAQKYPNDYDGILADAPAIYWPILLTAFTWPQVVMAQADYYPSQCEFKYFQNQSIAACDAFDGVVNGVIDDPFHCDFDPYTLVGEQITCGTENMNITETVAEIVKKIHDGPPGPSGETLWRGLEWGTTYATLANTTSVNGTTVAAKLPISETWILTFLKQDPSFNTSTLTVAEFTQLMVQSWTEYGGMIGTSDPNLSQFRDNGGKMLTWHGLADEVIMPRGTLLYRETVERVMGGRNLTDEFYRLFLAPGVSHCLGGYGPVPTDAFAALIAWVEDNQPPATLPASFVDSNGDEVTRNLCQYPLVSKYDGKSDPKVASSYQCVASY